MRIKTNSCHCKIVDETLAQTSLRYEKLIGVELNHEEIRNAFSQSHISTELLSIINSALIRYSTSPSMRITTGKNISSGRKRGLISFTESFQVPQLEPESWESTIDGSKADDGNNS